MHEQSLFNFRPSCLVRMSKDDIINQYDIFPIKIGEGNDAVVYKAKQKICNESWRAVKKIHRRYIDKEEYLLTEIQILKKLDHPGVLKIFQVFDDSEYVFIVTELCQGDSLLQQLKRRDYFPQNQAKIIFKKIIEIIAYCHHNKIIHRDLKLENLVYCCKEHIPQNIRLIDFGMSFNWSKDARVEIRNTFKSNKVVGTIYYMAPQIYKETYDHRVDIWSVGVILFVLLSGELPFFCGDDEQILQAIQQRKVPYEKLHKKKCSKQVIQLLKRMFESEHKRISIQQILKHAWFKASDKEKQQCKQEQGDYLSLIPFREFQIRQKYFEYCRQKIFQITEGECQNSVPSLENTNLFKTINWNNVYEFLKMDSMQKAVKIYMSYRLGKDKIWKYIKIFNYFKSGKRQQVQIQTLYEHLRLQYESCLSMICEKPRKNTQNAAQNRKNQRKMSSQGQKTTFSVKNIYEELLTFFEHNKHNFITHSMFISWVCDYSQFDKEQLQFLRTQLHKKDFELDGTNPLQSHVLMIHQIISHEFSQKRKKSKSQYGSQIKILPVNNGVDSRIAKIRQFPKLTLNLPKDPNTNLCKKKTPRKTVKQNILESISPTFIRRSPVDKIPQTKGSQTQRPKGSKLIENKGKQVGFLYGITKIISFL